MKKRKPDYIKTDRGRKTAFALQIFEEIHSQSGRFLQRISPGSCSSSCQWYDIGKERAIAKICQALREGPPKLSKKEDIALLPQPAAAEAKVLAAQQLQNIQKILLQNIQHLSNIIEEAPAQNVRQINELMEGVPSTQDIQQLGAMMEAPTAHPHKLSTCIPLVSNRKLDCFVGDMHEESKKELPEFMALRNFPSVPGKCTMCGCARPLKVTSKKFGMPSIPKQNKGLCTGCDVKVWVITANCTKESEGTQIKWCKGCKNFRTWACFGRKGHATKCKPCRDIQAERYKELKSKQQSTSFGSTLI